MAKDYSYLSNAGGEFVQNLYDSYLKDPESVDQSWQYFFEGFEFAKTNFSSTEIPDDLQQEFRVLNLINEYRVRGHLFTKTNPVRERRQYTPSLEIENFGLEKSHLDDTFQAGKEVGLGPAKLRDIIALLEETYCSSIGAEFMYARARKPGIVDWLKEKMEAGRNKPKFNSDDRKHILKKLNQAVAFESFLGNKYVGQKRFSIEGAETLIPALDAVIEFGSDLGIKEFVIGMAHRGRLNVLANILQKTYMDIFSEFEENIHTEHSFEGDVKYHLGYSSEVKTENGNDVHLSLVPNPSHLESVSPVAQGSARAKIDHKYQHDNNKLATILIHGDAAIAGQGVVYEVVQMSELDAQQTGGTIHVVINNQVGFTTNYLEARSSTYCTDVAKVTQSPVFHVNGDDAEAVVYATQLAMEFRQQFHKDVFIDLLCYRRHGHNEGDEPRFTQPELYSIIEKHPNPKEIYFNKLLAMGNVEATLAKEMEKEFKRFLQERLKEVKQNNLAVEYHSMQSAWKDLKIPQASDWLKPAKTAVPKKTLLPLANQISSVPEGYAVYDKMARIFDSRTKMLKEDRLDWAMGELLAYASLLKEGYHVRMCGQDSERGTFAHRHAILKVNDSEEEYVPLNNLSDKQGKFEIYNSFLSEYAALGFEFGYSWSAPNSLVIWEAQFGDFINGAQTIIDQYIASGLTKWKRLSGLVLLLPHGFEGQGPDHSSARLERFLELCAGNNMQVVYPTTPANHFHLLRRQIHRNFRIPLIVLTPKSLLRHPQATSTLGDMTQGSFQELIDDTYIDDAAKVKKLIFCTGKIYYDLAAQQAEDQRKDVAIIRMEQIYPLPEKQIEEVIAKYKHANQWVWVQEEPENMGAWPFLLRKFKWAPLEVVSRKENSSPATGYKKQHQTQQLYIIRKAFDIKPPSNTKAKKLATAKNK